MRKYFLAIALLLCFAGFAQTQEEKQQRIEASIRLSAKHGKMVQFTGIGMSKSIDFQDWLDRDFGAKNKESATKFTATTFVLVYTKRGSNPNPIKITYYFKKDETVAKVEITGKWLDIANLFLNYWERPLRIDEKKRGEIVWFNSFADRVAFNSTDGINAKITITNNGLNTFQ